MKVIVPTNNKGGVGKTKISMLLAEYFSKYAKKRVLAIDFDPQCNFSRRYLKMHSDPNSPEGYLPPIHPDYNPNDPEEDKDWDGRSSIAGIFFRQPVVPYPTCIENLDITPANAGQLLTAEMVRKSEVQDKIHKQLAYFLTAEEVQKAYDIVVVDTAPSKGPLTISAIKAASHIIIPSIMEAQSIQGIFGMLQLWMQESLRREDERPLNLIGILPNMVRNNNLHHDMLENLREHPAIAKYVIPHILGMKIVFAEVDADDASPRTVFDLSDKNPAKIQAIEVCKYIEKRMYEND